MVLIAGAMLHLGTNAGETAPPNIEEIIRQFNVANGVGQSQEVSDDYGIRTYSKSRTQFDGVTNEMQLTYLSLDPTQGVELPVLSTGVT